MEMTLRTFLSVPVEKCPSITVAGLAGFPDTRRMTQTPETQHENNYFQKLSLEATTRNVVEFLRMRMDSASSSTTHPSCLANLRASSGIKTGAQMIESANH